MTKIGTILSAAVIAALGAMPVELGPLSLGDAALAQGPPSWAGKGLGAAARDFGRGGPQAGVPGVGARDFGRGGPEAGVPGVGARDFGRGGPQAGVPGVGARDFGRGGPEADVPRLGGVPGNADHLCPPGLEGRGCFPPGAQKFLNGFCPRGLEITTADCIPPGLHVFGSGDVIPRDIRYERIFHRDLGLPAPSGGHHYARIDRDVYLVSEGTRQVVRAIGVLGATGY